MNEIWLQIAVIMTEDLLNDHDDDRADERLAMGPRASSGNVDLELKAGVVTRRYF